MEFIAASLPGVITAVVATYVGYRISNRATLDREARVIKREAAADLCVPLRDLRTLVRQWGRIDTSQDEVASAALSWAAAFDRQAHRLPPRWTHIGRSVGAAFGQVFGGVALAHLRPNLRDSQLSEPDFLWQDFADDYVTYALAGITRWGDGQSVPKRLDDFDSWLGATGRRDPHPTNVRSAHGSAGR